MAEEQTEIEPPVPDDESLGVPSIEGTYKKLDDILFQSSEVVRSAPFKEDTPLQINGEAVNLPMLYMDDLLFFQMPIDGSKTGQVFQVAFNGLHESCLGVFTGVTSDMISKGDFTGCSMYEITKTDGIGLPGDEKPQHALIEQPGVPTSASTIRLIYCPTETLSPRGKRQQRHPWEGMNELGSNTIECNLSKFTQKGTDKIRSKSIQGALQAFLNPSEPCRRFVMYVNTKDREFVSLSPATSPQIEIWQQTVPNNSRI